MGTLYAGFEAGVTSMSKPLTMPAGATKLYISLFGYNVNINGEHHLKVSNLKMRTVIPVEDDIVTKVTDVTGRVATLEASANVGIPDGSIVKGKLESTLVTELDSLFPYVPPVNDIIASLNSDADTVSYFYNGGDAVNVTYTESIVGGVKKYSINSASAYAGNKKPWISIGNKFDAAPLTEYLFKCDVEQATEKGVFTIIATNGVSTLSTQYAGFLTGATSASKSFITPVGTTKIEISLFGYNLEINGEHHITISNLTMTEVVAPVLTIMDRVAALENPPISDKSYFILDFDFGPTSWTELNITTVLDEFGYPFKFNFGPTADPDICWALVKRGCEMSTYFNEPAYLPTDAQMNSTDQTDIAKVDAYVKQALTVQYGLNYRDQLTWSTRQFTTGVALENALKKYGYAIQRLRAGLTLLPTTVSRNKLTKFFVSDNTTNWYTHTLDGIDLAIANGGSLAIFTHKLVPSDDASGINITDAQYRIILNKIKGYVDAGQAEVITYKQYFEKFRN